MVETPVQHPFRIFIFATMSVLFFSFMNLFVKLAAEDHAVVEIMFFRNALAILPVLMLIQAHKEGFGLLKTKRPLGHLLRGTVGTGSMGLVFLSYAMLPLADATAIQFAMPLMLTALSVPLLGEYVGRWRWGAVILGFVGVLVMVAPATGATPNWAGIGVALAAAFTTACTMTIVRRLGRTEHALTIVFYFSLWGSIVCALFLPWYWTPPSFESFMYLVGTGISGGIGQIFLTRAYAEGPAAYVSPFGYLMIVFSALFGWAIWAEVPAWNVWAGTAIVILSGLVILWRELRNHRRLAQDALMENAPTDVDVLEETGQDIDPVTYTQPEPENQKAA